MSAYTITLTADDVETIAFVGARYSWSGSMLALEEGDNELTEPEAWAIAEAIDADCEGGHLPFPLLNERSELYATLRRFRDSIV